MRFVLQLLTLLALLVAPLAAPVAAAQPSVGECSQMHSGKSPFSHHRTGEPCCVAIPPAIDTPPSAASAATPSLHVPIVASAEQFSLGAGPQFEDPPPRIA